METCNTDIKIEVDDDDSEDNNNSEQITRLEQPLALIKRKERDITERFPYIEEVTTTTPSRYRSISKFMPSKRRALACKIYKCIKINMFVFRCDTERDDDDVLETDENTVTSSVDKGNQFFVFYYFNDSLHCTFNVKEQRIYCH